MSPELVAGTLATVLTTVFSLPQALRALRADDVHGIAPLTALLVLFTAVSWAVFGFMIWDAAILVANVLAGIAAAVTVSVLVTRHRLKPRELGAVTAGFAVCLAIAIVLVGEDGAGYLGAILGASMAVPQTVRVMRGDIAGVSLSMYLLMSAMVVTWFVYGLLIEEFVAVLENVLAAPAAFLCAGRLVIERRGRGRRPGGHRRVALEQ